ncbi:hypothetical protein Tco_0017202 [Tanacetum coccineum]
MAVLMEPVVPEPPPAGGGGLPVPDLRTMKELCQSLKKWFEVDQIASVCQFKQRTFGLKNDMIQQVQNSCPFRRPGDDANKHLDKFLHVTQSMKVNGVSRLPLVYISSLTPCYIVTAEWFDRLQGIHQLFDNGKNILRKSSHSMETRNSNPSSLLLPFHNSLSGSTTSSSPSLPFSETSDYFLEEFADELAHITFPPGNDDLPFDAESIFKKLDEEKSKILTFLIKKLESPVQVISFLFPSILIHENLVEVTNFATPDKNVKKTTNASLILEDFNLPLPLYELPFHKEVPGLGALLSFSSENEEKVFKPRYFSLLNAFYLSSPGIIHGAQKAYWNRYLRKGRKSKPKRQNRTRNGKSGKDKAPPHVVEQFNLEEPVENPDPLAPMDDTRTMAQLLEAPTAGYEDAIVVPEIAADNFELKHGLLNLVQNKQFFGNDKKSSCPHPIFQQDHFYDEVPERPEVFNLLLIKLPPISSSPQIQVVSKEDFQATFKANDARDEEHAN